MTAGYYAVTGICPQRKITVLDLPTTPVRGKSYVCACGLTHVIMKYERWGWWVRCLTTGCILHIVYRESNRAVRRGLVHDSSHHPRIIIYEGTKYERYSAVIRINQPTLGNDDGP